MAGAAAAAEPIRVGGSLSDSGKYAEPSRMIRAGYELWADQINARGGLLGRPVELILYDDRSDVRRVDALYRKLFEEDRVDLVLSPYGSPATMAASDLSEKRRAVMIACSAASEAVWERGHQYLFGLYSTADRYCIGFLDLMARQNLRTIAVVYEDSPFHRSIRQGAERWARMFGIEVVYRRSFGRLEDLRDGALEALQAAAPGGLLFSGYPPQTYEWIDWMQAASYRPPALIFTIAPIHPGFYGKVGPYAEGVFGPSQWEPFERIPFPGTSRFIRDFVEYSGLMPSYHASAAFSACQILERAVTETRSLDHDRIRDYISRLDSVSVIGRFKVDPNGRQIGHNPLIIQWQGGRKEIVYPTKMQTAPAWFPPAAPAETGPR
jgi:branched-chain amino acid transport system substrate-binding protein